MRRRRISSGVNIFPASGPAICVLSPPRRCGVVELSIFARNSATSFDLIVRGNQFVRTWSYSMLCECSKFVRRTQSSSVGKNFKLSKK